SDRLHRLGAARHAIELAGAGFEGTDHALHRLVEEDADDPLQHARAGFEIDIEIDEAAAILLWNELPVIVEIAERALGVAHIDAAGAVEHDARGEALAHHLEADEQIGGDDIALPFAHARAQAPRQKLGIPLDIGDEVEKLLGGVRQK